MSKNTIRAFLCAVLILLVAVPASRSQVFDIVVRPDGTGDFTSIQEALNAVPENSESRTLIFIYPGSYREKIEHPSNRVNVSLVGASPESVTIDWDDYAGKDGMSSAETYTYWADGSDLYAENISFVNSAGPVGQALAIRTTGDRMVFKNCHFDGYQDTYYAHKNRQYNLRCTVRGTTDFIYGDATAVFEKCTIIGKKGGQYITAPADTKLISTLPDGSTFYHGQLFRECELLPGEGVGASAYYLGRPWQPNASTVFIHCTLGDHIKPRGWSTWSGNNHLSGFFAEYRSVDTDGQPVDTSQRADWSHQLSKAMVDSFYNLSYFLTKNRVIWDPVAITWSLDAPGNLSNDGTDLSWEAVPEARGYVVYQNDSAIGHTEGTGFNIQDIPAGDHEFSVRSVSAHGSLSGFPNEPALFADPILQDQRCLILRDRQLLFPETVDYRIFAINGTLMLTGNGKSRADLSRLDPGIYMVSCTGKTGTRTIHKIALRSF
jgi:pectinesterase